jgi:hypothetical protein
LQETVWPLTCDMRFFTLPNPVSSLPTQLAEIVLSLRSPVILHCTAMSVSNVGAAAGLVVSTLLFAINAKGLGFVRSNVVLPWVFWHPLYFRPIELALQFLCAGEVNQCHLDARSSSSSFQPLLSRLKVDDHLACHIIELFLELMNCC